MDFFEKHELIISLSLTKRSLILLWWQSEEYITKENYSHQNVRVMKPVPYVKYTIGNDIPAGNKCPLGCEFFESRDYATYLCIPSGLPQYPAKKNAG